MSHDFEDFPFYRGDCLIIENCPCKEYHEFYYDDIVDVSLINGKKRMVTIYD